MDRGAWWATMHAVTKSQTRPSDAHTHTHTHTNKPESWACISVEGGCLEPRATSQSPLTPNSGALLPPLDF